jgi:flagellar basal body-associated protein FliL
MNKKKIIIVALVVVLLGGYATYSFAMPKPVIHDKIAGPIYILPGQFVVNLSDGRYGKLTVALVLAPSQSTGGTADGAAAPPDGFGTLPEEAAVRDIITNTLTNQSGSTLIDQAGRERIKQRILQAILANTDVKATAVLFTDVAVQ